MAGPIERGIYLASRSPRRRELLAQIGVRYNLLLFRSRPESKEEVNEDPLAGELRTYLLVHHDGTFALFRGTRCPTWPSPKH